MLTRELSAGIHMAIAPGICYDGRLPLSASHPGYPRGPVMSVVGIERPKVNWPAVAVVAGIHVMALAALVPWLFSWTGVFLALAGCYVFGTLGINMGFH